MASLECGAFYKALGQASPNRILKSRMVFAISFQMLFFFLNSKIRQMIICNLSGENVDHHSIILSNLMCFQTF